MYVTLYHVVLTTGYFFIMQVSIYIQGGYVINMFLAFSLFVSVTLVYGLVKRGQRTTIQAKSELINYVPKVSLGLDIIGTDSTSWASSDLWVVVYTISLPLQKPVMQRNDWYLSVSQSNQPSPAYRYKTPQRTDIYENPSGIGYYTGYAKLWIHSWISHSTVHQMWQDMDDS